MRRKMFGCVLVVAFGGSVACGSASSDVASQDTEVIASAAAEEDGDREALPSSSWLTNDLSVEGPEGRSATLSLPEGFEVVEDPIVATESWIPDADVERQMIERRGQLMAEAVEQQAGGGSTQEAHNAVAEEQLERDRAEASVEGEHVNLRAYDMSSDDLREQVQAPWVSMSMTGGNLYSPERLEVIADYSATMPVEFIEIRDGVTALLMETTKEYMLLWQEDSDLSILLSARDYGPGELREIAELLTF